MKKTIKWFSVPMLLLTISLLSFTSQEEESEPEGKTYACKYVYTGSDKSYSCGGKGTYCTNALDCI